jgi:hypothetical protein
LYLNKGIFLKKEKHPHVVVHACNPSYLGQGGVGDEDDHDLRPAWPKTIKTPSQPTSWGVGACLKSKICEKIKLEDCGLSKIVIYY